MYFVPANSPFLSTPLPYPKRSRSERISADDERREQGAEVPEYFQTSAKQLGFQMSIGLRMLEPNATQAWDLSDPDLFSAVDEAPLWSCPFGEVLLDTVVTSNEGQYGIQYGIADDGGRVFYVLPTEHVR